MARTEYNGFDWDEMGKGGSIQTWAYKRGYLVRPERCAACNVRGVIPGEIIAHLEDYTEPISGAIFLCYRCHTMVHLRFENPLSWLTYIGFIRDGHTWPLTRSRFQVIRDHVSNSVDLFAMRPEAPRGRTVLDDISDGLLHPGPREQWDDKMSQIMEGKRSYWIPSDQERLFEPIA